MEEINEFKLSKPLKAHLYILLLYGGVLLSLPKIISDNVHFHFSPLMILILLFVVASFYVIHKGRLIIGNDYIAVHYPITKNLGWKIRRDEINECLLVPGALGMHKIIFKTDSCDKEILIRNWEIINEKSTNAVPNKGSPFALDKRDAKEYSVYKPLVKFNIHPREVSSSELVQIANKSMDLGKEAGALSIAALVFAVIAFIFDVYINNTKTVSSGHLNYIVGAGALLLSACFFRYLNKIQNYPARILIILLFGICSYWAIRSMSLTATKFTGKHALVTYTLQGVDKDSQTWIPRISGYPNYTLFFDPGNNKVKEIGSEVNIEIISGYFDVYLSPSSESKKLLINKQGW